MLPDLEGKRSRLLDIRMGTGSKSLAGSAREPEHWDGDEFEAHTHRLPIPYPSIVY